MSNSNFPGSYSTFSCKIDDAAQQAFNEAMKQILGVKYATVAVSQQIVAGLNYKFFCNSESVSPFPHNGVAIVSIYKPLNGPAHLTGIKSID